MFTSSAEALCAARTASGAWADFSRLGDAERVIPAGLVRDLMLGRHFTAADHENIRKVDPSYATGGIGSVSAPVPVTQAGVRIRGAIIEGMLDLDGCVGPGGGFLPALALEECRLVTMPGPCAVAALDFTGASLARLSLKGSRFTHVIGRGARINGSLDISYTLPLEGWMEQPWPGADMAAFRKRLIEDAATLRECFAVKNFTPPVRRQEIEAQPASDVAGAKSYCWLDMSGCHVGGEVTLFAAKLRAPSPKTSDWMQAQYALRLDRAIVEGSLDARGGVILDGGLNLHLARVRGEVWLGGAQLMQTAYGALDAQGAVFGGLFASGAPLKTHGGIHLVNARIEGNFDLNCADLDGAGSSALSAENLIVRGEMLLRGGTAANGSVRLQGARIEGMLDIDGGFLDGGQRDALAAASLFVRGSASFKGAIIRGCVWMYGAEIGERLRFNGALIIGSPAECGDSNTACGFSGTDLDVGDSVLMGQGFTTFGGFYLQRARVQKDVGAVNAKIVAETDTKSAIDFGWSHIHGNLILENNLFRGSINASHLRAAVLCDNAKGYHGASELKIDGFRYQNLYECDLSASEEKSVGCVASRISWLERMPEYQPQPYAHLVDVLIAQGRTEEAREILIAKRNKELVQSRKHISTDGPLSALMRASMYLTSRLFGLLFGYGLRPSRAICTVLAAFLAGWAFFGWANYRGAMVIDQQAVAGAVLEGKIGSQLSAAPVKTDVTCGGSIRPSLYALDVFIPLVDLRQENKCEIGIAEKAENLFAGVPMPWPNGWRWGAEVEVYRYLKAIYALSGWLIISLSLLTFSGLLQRVEGK